MTLISENKNAIIRQHMTVHAWTWDIINHQYIVSDH